MEKREQKERERARKGVAEEGNAARGSKMANQRSDTM